jgi:hypothetical protein
MQPLPTQPGSTPVRQLDRPIERSMDSRPRDSRPMDTRKPFSSRPVEASEAPRRYDKVSKVTPEEKEKFKSLLEDLIGTRGAYILDTKLNILGKVPITELNTTVKSLKSGMYAIVFDGVIDKDLVMTAEQANVSHLIAMSSRIRPGSSSVNILTAEDL